MTDHMPSRNRPPLGPSNQRNRGELADSRFLVPRFRSALLEVGGATKSGRAHGRFDEIARHDADARQPWVGYSIEMCREQLYVACSEGPAAKAETIRRVEHAAAEWKRAILTGFVEEPGAQAIPATSIAFAKETGEAVVALMEYRETGSESAAERARREVQDVLTVAVGVMDLTARRRSEMVRLSR